MEQINFFTRFLKRDQLFILIGVFALAALSWAYIINLSSMSSNPANSMIESVAMPQMSQWNIKDAMAAAIMWSVMMLAMMLPSAMPMILVFSAVNRKRHSLGNMFVPVWIFVFGYILVWAGFSLVAALIQFGLRNFALISTEIRIINPILSGVVLIAAGAYQFTPIKNVCLKNCQSPLGFIMGNWQEGKLGAFVMGLQHGLYCVGCCWILMLLLFVAGVMNLLWISIIAIFIFMEKLAPLSNLLSRIAGALFVAWGLALITKFI